MMKLLFAAASFFASAPLLVSGVDSGVDNDDYSPPLTSSKLQIQIPAGLRKEGGYDHRESLFGEYPYGSSIATTVFHASSNFCNNIDLDESWTSPFILMIDRGDCTFVTKVRNAQIAGAAAVIIADNVCLCSDEKCTGPRSTSFCEADEPIMSDDGSGSDIRIPSFLMFKTDADLARDEIIKNGNVQMEMSWSLPKPDDRVEYDIWTVPTHNLNREFLSNFGDVAVALGKRAYFTPYMNIFDGIVSGCHGLGQADTAICYNLCTNNGRYCANDPDGDLDRGISGADVVKESLRRICIWNKYGEDDGIGEIWWDYVREFTRLCNTEDYFMNDDCVKDAYRHAKIAVYDASEIDSCMKNSGGLEDDVSNVFLERQIKAREKSGVVIFPAVVVNRVPLRGSLTVNTVFEAICAGFADGTKPETCNQCERCQDHQGDCVRANGVCGISTSTAAAGGGVSTFAFSISMLSLVALFAGLSILHYKRTRKEMRDNVRGILSEYMLLDENNHASHNEALL